MSNDIFDFMTGNRGVPRKKSASTVVHNAIDDGVLQDMTDKAELFGKTLKAAPTVEIDGKPKEVKHWGDLVGDVFRALHTNDDVGTLDASDILPSREPNRRIMQRFIADDKFRAMKPDTTHDEIASAFGSMRAATELEKLANGAMKDIHEEAAAAEKAENRIERAETKLEDLREQARQMHQGGQPIPKDLQGQIDDQVKRKTNARHDLAKNQKAMADSPMNVEASRIIEKAAKEAKEAAEVVHSLPGMGKGQKQQMNADEALKLANLFAENPTLFEIARMLGRIMRDMRFKRARRMEGGVEEVTGIALGNDLGEILPSEFMLLMDPLLEGVFFQDYAMESLLVREYRGTTEAGKGPLVAVVDESYSMDGTRFTWAKALTMAIVAIARKEHRDAAVVSFASNGETQAWEFPHKEKMDAEKMVEMIGHNFRGGTDIDGGVTVARDIIAKDERFMRADLVLITDGESREMDGHKALVTDLANLGVRTHGIQVGGPPSDYLEGTCQNVTSAMDLTGANDATDMLAAGIN